jgi:DNA-binding transcriptional MocR family regulator
MAKARNRPNNTGRTDTSDHFTKLFRPTMETAAWGALSITAQALYPWLKLEWKGPQYNRNGQIQLSVKQAANKLGTSVNTANRAFHDLQAKGFIVITEMGALGVAGQGKSPKYELTEIAMPHSGEHSGRKLYVQWTEGNDFPIQKHNANNRCGTNGNKIPSQKQ